MIVGFPGRIHPGRLSACLLALLSFWSILNGSGAVAQTPTEVVSQALANSHQAAKESTKIDFSFAGKKVGVSCLRNGTDKFSITTSTNGQVTDIVVTGQSLYSRTAGGVWTVSTLSAQLLGQLLRPVSDRPAPIFADLSEGPSATIGNRQQRVFQGKGEWPIGNITAKGNWKLFVDRRSVLLTQIEFSGQCGDQPCGFIQKSSYDAPSPVVVPTVENTRFVIVRLDRNGRAKAFLHAAVPGEAGSLKDLGSVRTDLQDASAVAEAVGSPAVYALSPEGFLSWRRFDQGADGKVVESPSLTIDDGWSGMSAILAGENGALYGRYPNESGYNFAFRWRRHLGYAGGGDKWDRLIADIGNNGEWGIYERVFSGSDGVIYSILPDGDLIWHKHDGYLDGQDKWSAETPTVGNGWSSIKAVAAVGQGVMYVVDETGRLLWFRHRGYLTGEYLWDGPVVIGSGWNDTKAVFVFPAR